jgi:hypothetical protein
MEMPAQDKAGMAGHAGMEMPGQAESETPGHAGHAMAGTTTSESSPHAGMQHERAAPGSTAAPSSHAGMQHGSPAARPAASQSGTGEAAGHAGHGGREQAPAERPWRAPSEPLAKSAVAGPGQPAATLEPDPLDAPTETSEMDAKRSTELARGMGAGGHGMMHGTGSYRQLDAGRESVQKAETGMPDHQGMGHGSMPPSTPTPAPMKPRPAVTPPPTPGGHVHPGGGHR